MDGCVDCVECSTSAVLHVRQVRALSFCVGIVRIVLMHGALRLFGQKNRAPIAVLSRLAEIGSAAALLHMQGLPRNYWSCC